jgi:hypothetical protein
VEDKGVWRGKRERERERERGGREETREQGEEGVAGVKGVGQDPGGARDERSMVRSTEGMMLLWWCYTALPLSDTMQAK